MAYEHTFSAYKPESSTGRKKAFLPTPPAFGAPVELDPNPIGIKDLLRHQSRVHGLSCSVVFEILCLAVLIQYRLVMDGQTDTR